VLAAFSAEPVIARRLALIAESRRRSARGRYAVVFRDDGSVLAAAPATEGLRVVQNGRVAGQGRRRRRSAAGAGIARRRSWSRARREIPLPAGGTQTVAQVEIGYSFAERAAEIRPSPG